jgi:hypothetical protein
MSINQNFNFQIFFRNKNLLKSKVEKCEFIVFLDYKIGYLNWENIIYFGSNMK